MNPQPPSPSRLLRVSALAARWLLGLLLGAFFVLTALWGFLHGWIVPRIEEFRPAIEIQASRMLGVPVRIGAISAQTLGLVPSFELQDVVLHDTRGDVALRLPRVMAALSPRSAAQLGFEQLYIDGPELDVRRDPGGAIFVAGLKLGDAGADAEDTRLQRWFFSQTEFLIRNGRIRWTDELRGAEPLALDRLNLVVRNSGRRHAMGLEASLPPAWGGQVSISGQFRQPLLSVNTGHWRDWDGQLFASFERVDLSRLRRHADLGLDVREGNGALRAWVDLRRGEITGATADLALAEVSLSLDPQRDPLTLLDISGRLSGTQRPDGFSFATQSLQFQMPDGRPWPGGNVAVSWTDGSGDRPPKGELRGDQLDLAALALMTNLLPLDAAARTAITALAPQGLVEQLEAHWSGAGPWPAKFDARGKLSGLHIAAQPLPAAGPGAGIRPGRPGVSGANLSFDLTQAGGKASVTLASGTLVFPGVFDDPVMALDRLSSEVLWQVQGEKLAVQLNRLKFANSAAEGEAQISWRTSDPAKSTGRARFPGVLDVQGSLSRADAAQIRRYLPLVLPASARDYVGESVQQGRASSVRFRVKGDVYDMPFSDPRQGEFTVAAVLENVKFDFAPRARKPDGSGEWPPLTQLSGELVFERAGMQVRNASGRVEGLPGVQIMRADAQIADLSNTVVQVSADARGPLSEVLGLVAASPVREWTARALDRASGTGSADYRLRLNLPMRDLAASRVQGAVVLAGSDVQISPETPLFSRARGQVGFTETGFMLQGVKAAWLGGEVQLDGGTARASAAGDPQAEPRLLFRAQGTATAQGLRQAPELGVVAQLAHRASGAAAYSATLGLRQGVPELTVSSTLQGMALDWPAPLTKPADSSLPLRFENTLTSAPQAGGDERLQDQISLALGSLVSVNYIRDVSIAPPRVLRGGIGVGLAAGESVPLPLAGVAANLRLGDVNIDAWQAALAALSGAMEEIAAKPYAESGKAIFGASTGTAAPAAPSQAGADRAPHWLATAAQAYLPTVIAVRAAELQLDGHRIQNIVAGASREGATWRANLDARELSGYVEYRQSSPGNPGRVYARLARLAIEPSAATGIEAILDKQPVSIPALDIVVEDLDLRGKQLGRVEVEAVNRSVSANRDGQPLETVREWRLNKFNVIVPEARFSAVGTWAVTGASATAPAAATAQALAARRMVMNYRMDIADTGQLLGRFGMKDVVRGGRGSLDGQVSWTGSPLALDYPSLGGQFQLGIEEGQFLKADPGLAKLLSVLSLQSLPRRLSLDFRDLFSEGFSFDFLRGDVRIDRGIAYTNNLQMKGLNAAALMEGQSDIAKGTQSIKVVVVPEINAGTASLVASVINPVVGLTTFLTQMVLRRPLIEAATQEFQVQGSWDDPRIVKIDRRPSSPGRPAEDGAGQPAADSPKESPP